MFVTKKEFKKFIEDNSFSALHDVSEYKNIGDVSANIYVLTKACYLAAYYNSAKDTYMIMPERKGVFSKSRRRFIKAVL